MERSSPLECCRGHPLLLGISLAKHAEKERRRDAQKEEFANLSAPILSELTAVGLNYSSTEELRHSGERYEKAVPILINWLPLIKNQRLKESIVRALSVPWAKPVAALPLIAEFKNAVGLTSDSLKWAIGNALSIVADDNVFNEIAELVKDKRHGKAREMLAIALGNMKGPRTVDLLIELLSDDQVAGHALMSLGKLKAQKARPNIELLLNHPKPWVRKEAKRALAKLDKFSIRRRGKAEQVRNI
jgi:hypothetical protein